MAERTAAEERAWQAARLVVLERDGYRCVECGAQDKTQLDVHHVLPRALGGQDEPANLVVLCDLCHAARHPTLQVSLARRTLESLVLRLARLLDSENELPQDFDRLTAALHVLGKAEFRQGQLEVILAVLRGESVLTVLPTGRGKSLCFQLPAILGHRVTYVVVPLMSLMQDQVSALMRVKIPATFINSDLSKEEKAARYDLLSKGAMRLLYLAPERLDPAEVSPNEVARLSALRPDYLVVDEAHCVVRWKNFRPSYARLARVRHDLGDPPILAFTATAGLQLQQQILRDLKIPNATVFRHDVDRPNIALVRVTTEESEPDRVRLVAGLLRQHQGRGKALVFVPTIRVGKTLAASLRSFGLQVPFYHGQLDSLVRQSLQGRFTGQLEPAVDAVVCTNAFGMGLDVPNIRLVVHWVQPESMEDYLQEIGRAGRDGEPALAVVLKCQGDTGIRRYLAEKNTEDAAAPGLARDAILAERYRSIDLLDRAIRDRQHCFRATLLDYFGAGGPPHRRSLVMRLLEWLFALRPWVDKAQFCCDACDPERARLLVQGAKWAAGGMGGGSP